MLFNIHSDRTLQHSKSNHNLPPLMTLDEKSFQTRQRTGAKPYPVPLFRERARFCTEFGSDGNLNRRNFRVIDRNWGLPYPDKVERSGNCEERKTVLRIQSAEYITRKERHRQGPHSI